MLQAPDGRQYTCIPCSTIQKREWVEKNRDRRRAWEREYWEKIQEQYNAYHKRIYDFHKHRGYWLRWRYGAPLGTYERL
jgi:hypothetical protein